MWIVSGKEFGRSLVCQEATWNVLTEFPRCVWIGLCLQVRNVPVTARINTEIYPFRVIACYLLLPTPLLSDGPTVRRHIISNGVPIVTEDTVRGLEYLHFSEQHVLALGVCYKRQIVSLNMQNIGKIFRFHADSWVAKAIIVVIIIIIFINSVRIILL
jgi:hypothetical protein